MAGSPEQPPPTPATTATAAADASTRSTATTITGRHTAQITPGQLLGLALPGLSLAGYAVGRDL